MANSDFNPKSKMKMRDCFFASDGLKLHYAEWGEPDHDETLVLVHGNRDQCRSWDFFISALASRMSRSCHVVAVDLRGHGDSDWSSKDRAYHHQDFVLDLAGLLRHLKKDSITIIGHSLGASMAVLFAGSCPSRVRKLVLIEATGPLARKDEDAPKLLAEWLEGDQDQPEGYFYPALEDAARAIKTKFPLIPEEVCLHMARHGTKPTEQGWMWKYDPRLRARSLSTFSDSQIRAFIERIDCPTLLVYGGESDFVGSPRASRMSLFKNGRIVGISGSGHHVPHEEPEELAEIVGNFLWR